MNAYRTKTQKLSGTDFKEVREKARNLYQNIKKKSRRKPYIRSKFFKKEKIFLDLFWSHLFEKNYWDQTRRLKFFPCAIELVENSSSEPISKQNPNKESEVLHKFEGITPSKEVFFVCIKEQNKGKKWLMSIYPDNSKKKAFR